MSVRLSPHTIKRILRDYFRGLPQKLIAARVAADQASISHYATIFREFADDMGILNAAKEFNVYSEVDELRSLATELYKSGMTAAETKNGANIIKAFSKLGVEPEQHTALVKVCKQVSDPGFVQAAIKLANIEHGTGLSYAEIMSKFEKISFQLPVSNNQLLAIQGKIESANSELAGKKQEIAAIQLRVEESQKNEVAKEKEMEQKLDAKRKKLGVKEKEIEEVASLKAKMGEQGLDIATLIKLAEEFHQ